jgi:hypothetical protein
MIVVGGAVATCAGGDAAVGWVAAGELAANAAVALAKLSRPIAWSRYRDFMASPG